jgi:hypothetical protein
VPASLANELKRQARAEGLNASAYLRRIIIRDLAAAGR